MASIVLGMYIVSCVSSANSIYSICELVDGLLSELRCSVKIEKNGTEDRALWNTESERG